MKGEERISEQEAVALAGVSARTLLRFSESGYLAIETMPDGTRTFQTSQILEIFGGAAPSSQTQTTPPSHSEMPVEEEVPQELKTCSMDLTPPPSPKEAPLTTAAVPDSTTSAKESALETENQRLRNLLSIQERILDAKDDEIADLKNQRGWLRERVEKLEEKADRDQILLLSETQTIRKLIAIQEARKSPVRNLLEWIGVLPSPAEITAIPQQTDYSQKAPTGASSRTIEVRTAANDQ